jgi:hypothetical protein
MAEIIDTKALKLQREAALSKLLEQIKSDGTWRQWLNGSYKLYIAKVCKSLGEAEDEGNGKAWDASCFRGGNWAAVPKEAFNKWIKSQMDAGLDSDLFGNPLKRAIVLPQGLTFDGLPDEMVDFIKDKLAEVKRLKEKVVALESHMNVKDRKVLELQTQIDSIVEAKAAIDEHYFFSIRSLEYD